jgi:ABC-type nickel/cobalt efflux system permease component RcnA
VGDEKTSEPKRERERERERESETKRKGEQSRSPALTRSTAGAVLALGCLRVARAVLVVAAGWACKRDKSTGMHELVHVRPRAHTHTHARMHAHRQHAHTPTHTRAHTDLGLVGFRACR